MEEIEVSLLSENEVFGSKKIECIEKMGGVCKVADYAIALGAFVDNNLISSMWALSNSDGTDVRTIDKYGNRSFCLASSRRIQLRPVIHYPNIKELKDQRRNKEDCIEIEFGEYPQKAVGRLSALLESKKQDGLLQKTGKVYTIDAIQDRTNQKFTPKSIEEYYFNDKKYIRLLYNNEFGFNLSNDKKYYRGDYLWAEVCPITWLVDLKEQLLISKYVLLSGIRFGEKNSYDGNFNKAEAYQYLNQYFIKEIIPSKIVKKQEEVIEWQERQRKLQERENPYHFDMKTITEEEIIKGSIDSNIPVFLHGMSSDGKSDRVKEIDPHSITLYMENVSLDGFVGKTVYHQEQGKMIDLPPTWYERLKKICEQEPNKNHILFLEEFTNATPSVQGKVNDLVLERVLDGKWPLPENVRIVAAGNEVEDSLAANPLTETVFNRFAHVYIKTTPENWLIWAKEHHIHPAIYSYIAYRRDHSLRTKYDGKKPNADPRKWEMASKMLYQTNNPEMLRSLVGEEIAEDFISFCKKSVITIEDVLTGNYKVEELKFFNTAEKYATVMALAQVDEEHVETIRDFVEQFGKEYSTIFDVLWAQEREDRQNILAGIQDIKVLKRTLDSKIRGYNVHS